MRKIISFGLVILLCATFIPALVSIVQAEIKPAWTVPNGYNEHDYNCCAAFLEQTNSDGITNGSQYSNVYDVNDPETWGGYWHLDDDGFMRLYPRFEFVTVNGEQRLRKIWLETDATMYVSGSFDFPGCTALEEVHAGWGSYYECYSRYDFSGDTSLLYLKAGANGYETQLNVSGCTALCYLDFCGFDIAEMDLSDCTALIYLACSCDELTELDLSNNTALKDLICEVTPLTRIDLSNCPYLEGVRIKDTMLTELDLSHNPLLPIDGVYAEGNGTIGYYYEEMEEETWTCVYAKPNEGETFLGWYDSQGEFLSDELFFDTLGIDETIVTAKFTGGSEPQPIPGDVNGSGAVDVADAVIVMRASMGLIELTEQQFAAGDINGDGQINITDAVTLLRMAMGIA